MSINVDTQPSLDLRRKLYQAMKWNASCLRHFLILLFAEMYNLGALDMVDVPPPPVPMIVPPPIPPPAAPPFDELIQQSQWNLQQQEQHLHTLRQVQIHHSYVLTFGEKYKTQLTFPWSKTKRDVLVFHFSLRIITECLEIIYWSLHPNLIYYGCLVELIVSWWCPGFMIWSEEINL